MPDDLAPSRTISGTVEADGKAVGQGFSVTHQNTGVYVVKFDKPFVSIYEPSYTFKLEIIDFLGSDNILAGGMLDNGNFAILKKASVIGFKYFTFIIEDNGIFMKDMPVRFSAMGFDEENPNEYPKHDKHHKHHKNH